MIIKELSVEDINRYEDIMLQLLIYSYESSFQLDKVNCVEICKKKVQSLKEYLCNNSAKIIGAIINDELVGFLWSYVHEYFGEKRIHVNHVSVKKTYRGKGIGKCLMEELGNRARKQNIDVIDLIVSEANKEALTMYRKIGFSTERRYMKRKL